MMDLLNDYIDIFAWTYAIMPGLNMDIIVEGFLWDLNVSLLSKN